MKNTIKVMGLLMLTMAFKCNDDDNNDYCADKDIITSSLESQYGCDDVPFIFDISLIERFLVINTQEDFDNLVIGSCSPQIDFEMYDLILGRQNLPNGIDTIRHTAIEDCETYNVTLTVTYTLDDTTQMPLVTYQILVPKLINPEGTMVEVQIN